MNDLFSVAYFFILACIVTFVFGCGEDSSPDPVVTPTQASPTAFTGESIQKTWKALCVDGNQATIDASYNTCLITFSGDAVTCETKRTDNKLKLSKTWEEIVATAMANYDQCLTDIRVGATYCQGKYEEEIAFEVNLKCEQAASWY